jgi:hypothetical protein
MKKPENYFELGIFIILCTFCFVVSVSVIGLFIIGIPTTPANMQVRLEMIGLLKETTVAAIAIASAKIIGNYIKKE